MTYVTYFCDVFLRPCMTYRVDVKYVVQRWLTAHAVDMGIQSSVAVVDTNWKQYEASLFDYLTGPHMCPTLKTLEVLIETDMSESMMFTSPVSKLQIYYCTSSHGLL